jgi:membrane protein YdbS with pleckstrin-like domain
MNIKKRKSGYKDQSFCIWHIAVAAIAMILSFVANQTGRPDIGFPFLTLAYFIVIVFIIYMFVKLLIQRFY